MDCLTASIILSITKLGERLVKCIIFVHHNKCKINMHTYLTDLKYLNGIVYVDT